MVKDSSAWFEARKQTKFLGQRVEVVYRANLASDAPPIAAVEFGGYSSGDTRPSTPLETIEELSRIIALFTRSEGLLENEANWDRRMLQADIGSIKANCVRNKKTVVIIQHQSGTIERELSAELVKEIDRFIEDVRANLGRVRGALV